VTGYDREFFERQRVGAASSAAVIAPWLVEWLRPRSVVDVGCGVGEWLAAFARLGVEDVVGVDGDHVDRARLAIPAERFVARDLARPFALDRSFDVALCLEVGEHLPETSAEGLIASLAALAPVVVFSAAVPHQGGTGHVTERWPAWWAERFRARGYEWTDPIRPRAWNDARVEPWYAQNAIVYRRPGAAAGLPGGGDASADGAPLSLVHPWLLERHAKRSAPTLRNAWRAVRGAIARPFRGGD
jgi:SAM-dependent methyltransferase